MVTMKAVDTSGTEVLCRFSRIIWDENHKAEGTLCKMRHGDYYSFLAIDYKLDSLTPKNLYEILERMVSREAESTGNGLLLLEAGYTIHTGEEPTVGT